MKREIKFKVFDYRNQEWCIDGSGDKKTELFIPIKSLVEQDTIGVTDDGDMCEGLD
jgi:hypothetical protein